MTAVGSVVECIAGDPSCVAEELVGDGSESGEPSAFGDEESLFRVDVQDVLDDFPVVEDAGFGVGEAGIGVCASVSCEEYEESSGLVVFLPEHEFGVGVLVPGEVEFKGCGQEGFQVEEGVEGQELVLAEPLCVGLVVLECFSELSGFAQTRAWAVDLGFVACPLDLASAPSEGVQFREVSSDLFEGVNMGVVLHGEGCPPE